ncbi:MAG: NYN domain-containing protein [Candidatus Omnitrophota bacterium]|jgi:uncharacterized protein (TIGR00288 family)
MNRNDKVIIFVDGNYVYKSLKEEKNLEFIAAELVKLLEGAYSKLEGNNDLRRIYYYNTYPPLESDKSRKESVDKLIWQIENKAKLSLAEVQKEIGIMFSKHITKQEVLKKFNLTEEEFIAQEMFYNSSQQMKFYEKLQYGGWKVILKKLKKDKEGKYHQKGIDIYIASDMLSLAFEDGYDTAMLVSGDADFIEIVNKIQERGKLVYLSCFEHGKSWDLQKSCDGYINLDSIIGSILKERKK